MGIAQAAVYLIRPTTSYRLLAYGEGAREVGLVAASFALLPIFLAIRSAGCPTDAARRCS